MTKCVICLKSIESIDSLFKHILKCQKIKKMHCVYCVFGAIKDMEIAQHLADDHASEIPLSCTRTLNNSNEVSQI